MFCENCGLQSEEKRFCNIKCARSFSTKASRKQINEKVRETLTQPRIERACLHCNKVVLRLASAKEKYCGEACARKAQVTPVRVCPTCKEDFKRRKGQIYCSNSCFQNSPGTKENLSKKRIEALKRGLVNLRSIRCLYDFQGQSVRCDSKLEYACLDWFVRNFFVLSIERSNSSILYEDGAQIRRYLPDFKIETLGETYIVECKSELYSESLNKRWEGYRRTAPLKKIALEKFAAENGLVSFWFEPSTKGSKYRSLNPAPCS